MTNDVMGHLLDLIISIMKISTHRAYRLAARPYCENESSYSVVGECVIVLLCRFPQISCLVFSCKCIGILNEQYTWASPHSHGAVQHSILNVKSLHRTLMHPSGWSAHGRRWWKIESRLCFWQFADFYMHTIVTDWRLLNFASTSLGTTAS